MSPTSHKSGASGMTATWCCERCARLAWARERAQVLRLSRKAAGAWPVQLCCKDSFYELMGCRCTSILYERHAEVFASRTTGTHTPVKMPHPHRLSHLKAGHWGLPCIVFCNVSSISALSVHPAAAALSLAAHSHDRSQAKASLAAVAALGMLCMLSVDCHQCRMPDATKVFWSL